MNTMNTITGGSSPSRSSTHSMHKTFANLPVNVSPPPPARPTSADFLPAYEAAVNNNLRNFGDPEAQHANLQPFDQITDPTPKHGMTKKRRYLIVGSLILLVIIVGTIMAGLLSGKFAGDKNAVSAPSNSTQTSTAVVTVAETTTQTSSLSTRETGALTTVTATETTSVTVAPSEPTSTSPSVVSATTLVTRTVAGPSSELFTSFVTVTSSPESSSTTSEVLPPVISATTYITRTAAGTSTEVMTSFVTISGTIQLSTFSYAPASTTSTAPTTSPASSRTPNTLKARSSTSSQATTIAAKILPSPHSHIPKPSEHLPSPPPRPVSSPATTSVPPIISGNPSGPSLTTTLASKPEGGWINYCGVVGEACDG